MRMSPSSNGISRLTSLSAVVLPPPEGPTSTQNVPAGIVERERRQRRAVAPRVALRDVVEDDLRCAGAERHAAVLIPARPMTPPAATSTAVIAIASRKPSRSSVLLAPATAAPTTAIPSRPATRAIALFTPDAIPASLLTRVGEHRRGERRHDQREAEREDEERRKELRPVREGGTEPRDRCEPHRAISGPTPMKKRGPKRIDSRPTRPRQEEHHHGDREQSRARSGPASSPRSAAGRARGRTSGSRGRRRRCTVSRFANEKLRRRKSRSGSIGVGARRSQRTNSTKQHDAADERDDDQRVAEAAARRLDQGEHRPGEAERAETGRRRRRCAAAARRGPGSAPRYATSAIVTATNGTLIRKIAAPRGMRDEPAAGERPDHERDAGPRRPGADRGAALLAAERPP